MVKKKLVSYNHVKVSNECLEAGANDWEAFRVLSELQNYSDADPTILKQKAISILKKYNPEAAKKLASLNQIKVYTSNYDLAIFDKQKIVESLIRETDLSRGLSSQIATEVENKLHELKKNLVSSLMIRQFVSVKLIEYDLTSAYEKYVRLGLPVYDISNIIKENKQDLIKEKVLENYYLSNMNPEVKKAFFDSKIHISGLPYLKSKVYHSSVPISKYLLPLKNKARLAKSDLILKIIDSIDDAIKKSYTIPSIDKFNYHLAEYYSKIESKGNFVKNLLLIVDKSLELYSSSSEKLTISLSTGVKKDESFSFLRFNDLARHLLEEICIEYDQLKSEQKLKKIELKISISSEKDLEALPQKVKDIIFNSEITVHQAPSYGKASLKNMFLPEAEYDYISSHISINLPMLIEPSLNKEKYLNSLNQNLLTLKKLTNQIDSQSSYSSIGLYGLENAVTSLTESDIYDYESKTLVTEIQSLITKKFPKNKFLLSAVNDDVAINRFQRFEKAVNGCSKDMLESLTPSSINSFFTGGYLIETDSIDSFYSLLKNKSLQLKLKK